MYHILLIIWAYRLYSAYYFSSDLLYSDQGFAIEAVLSETIQDYNIRVSIEASQYRSQPV